jgi:hypothetical protein
MISFSSDVGIILSSTDFWSGRSMDEISENEYRGLMTSHVMANTTTELKNCSIEAELNQVRTFGNH